MKIVENEIQSTTEISQNKKLPRYLTKLLTNIYTHFNNNFVEYSAFWLKWNLIPFTNWKYIGKMWFFFFVFMRVKMVTVKIMTSFSVILGYQKWTAQGKKKVYLMSYEMVFVIISSFFFCCSVLWSKWKIQFSVWF